MKMIRVGDYLYKKVEANRFVSDDAEQAKDYLKRVSALDGDGSIDLDYGAEVWIGVIHDGSGFNPGAAIYVEQGARHPDTVLQGAHEILADKIVEDEAYVEELMLEWEDEWMEILTETFDGMAFGPFDPTTAADIISSNKYASEYIDIYEAEEEEEDYE